jgi:asparagine synthetase B (glutamine-hydrolysing)
LNQKRIRYMIRKLLEDHIKNNVPDSEIAVLLSGGVDSVSVGLAAESAGKEVHAYSFYLNGAPSYDFIKAAEVAHKRNWDFTPIVVPTENLIEDWHRLVELTCRKKTHFECVFPFLYVYPEIEEKYVLTGWGADGYFGPSKKAMMRYSSYKKKRNYVAYCKEHNQKRLNWNEFRLAYLDGDCAGLKEHTNLATKHNKIHVTPYLDADVRKLLMSKSYKELNKPKQKYFIRSDFTELKKFGTIKPHQNLHLNAGVDKLFETLLNNPEINLKGRKRMMDVCRDWSNGVLPI